MQEEEEAEEKNETKREKPTLSNKNNNCSNYDSCPEYSSNPSSVIKYEWKSRKQVNWMWRTLEKRISQIHRDGKREGEKNEL